MAMTYYATGEIVDSEERLGGDLLSVLEGEAQGDDGGEWNVSATLVWPLGRDGVVALAEGDLTLAPATESASDDAPTLAAVLVAGSVRVDAETGAVSVRAHFRVEDDQPTIAGGPPSPPKVSVLLTGEAPERAAWSCTRRRSTVDLPVPDGPTSSPSRQPSRSRGSDGSTKGSHSPLNVYWKAEEMASVAASHCTDARSRRGADAPKTL